MFVSAAIPNLELSTPELLLAIGAMALLMIGVFMGDRSMRLVTGLSVALLVLAAIWLIFADEVGLAMNGAFVLDPFARLMKILVLIGSAVAGSVGYLAGSDILTSGLIAVIVGIAILAFRRWRQVRRLLDLGAGEPG